MINQVHHNVINWPGIIDNYYCYLRLIGCTNREAACKQQGEMILKCIKCISKLYLIPFSVHLPNSNTWKIWPTLKYLIKEQCLCTDYFPLKTQSMHSLCGHHEVINWPLIIDPSSCLPIRKQYVISNKHQKVLENHTTMSVSFTVEVSSVQHHTGAVQGSPLYSTIPVELPGRVQIIISYDELHFLQWASITSLFTDFTLRPVLVTQ